MLVNITLTWWRTFSKNVLFTICMTPVVSLERISFYKCTFIMDAPLAMLSWWCWAIFLRPTWWRCLLMTSNCASQEQQNQVRNLPIYWLFSYYHSKHRDFKTLNCSRLLAGPSSEISAYGGAAAVRIKTKTWDAKMDLMSGILSTLREKNRPNKWNGGNEMKCDFKRRAAGRREYGGGSGFARRR